MTEPKLTREQWLARAEEALIDAHHARLAAQDAQTKSDRDFALVAARTREFEAWNYKQKAWTS